MEEDQVQRKFFGLGLNGKDEKKLSINNLSLLRNFLLLVIIFNIFQRGIENFYFNELRFKIFNYINCSIM